MRLNPFDAFVLMNGGWGEVWAGSLDDAMSLFLRARALSPRDPTAFFVLTGLAMASLMSGDCEEGVAWASEAAAVYASWDATFFVLGLSLAHCGRLHEAQHAFQRARQLLEGTTLEHMVAMLPIRDRDRIAIIEEGIRLVEGATAGGSPPASTG